MTRSRDLPELAIGVGVLLLFVAVVFVGPASAQIPDKFTNLKVVPKDISKDDLVATMRGFSSALGVHCGYCHVRKGEGPRAETDWPADDKPEKQTARVMMKMTRLINSQELAKITTKHPDRVEVRCATCHHGQPRPRQIDDVLADSYKKGGLDSLRATYESLRKEYYGTGTYDFSEDMLPSLAERLAGRDNPELLLKLAQYNLERNPDSGAAHLFLGQAYATSGRKDEAITELKKAVEISPELKENVQRQLDRLQGK